MSDFLVSLIRIYNETLILGLNLLTVDVPQKEKKKGLFTSSKAHQKSVSELDAAREAFLFKSLQEIVEGSSYHSKSVKAKKNFLFNLYQVHIYIWQYSIGGVENLIWQVAFISGAGERMLLPYWSWGWCIGP